MEADFNADDEDEECPRTIWEDAHAGILLDQETIAARRCEACRDEWALWDRIIKDAGSREIGERAFRAIQTDEDLEEFPKLKRRLSWEAFSDWKIYRKEVKRYEGNELRKQRLKMRNK